MAEDGRNGACTSGATPLWWFLVEKQVGKGEMEAQPKSKACGLELFSSWRLLVCRLELLKARRGGREVYCTDGRSWLNKRSIRVMREERKKKGRDER